MVKLETLLSAKSPLLVATMVGWDSLSSLIILSHLVVTSKQWTCFAPNGDSISNEIYQPCIRIDGVHSMCCRLNDVEPDTCLPSGLCRSKKDKEHRGVWRDFCTDSSWKSPNCLSRTICTDEVSNL